MTPPQATDFIGREIAHYKVLDYLGGGGMGVVYTAEDIGLKRVVALKFLPAELTQNAQVKERFKQEARTASALDHPNICTIHQIGETDDGQMFICMSFYEGNTLTDLIKKAKPDTLQTVTLCMQIARGLAKAHENGIIHRDIKPANIMVTKDELIKILDFGLAKLSGTTKLTKTGTTMGTPAYMSPEQVRGKEIGPQSDIFSLGVIMYEMLTGKLPFEGENEMSMMYAIVNNSPPAIKSLNPDTPQKVAGIVEKAMAKKLEDRYRTMSDMLNDLTEIRLDLLRNAETQEVAPVKDDVTKTIITPNIPEEKPPAEKQTKKDATIKPPPPIREVKTKKPVGRFIALLLIVAIAAGGYFSREQIQPWFENLLSNTGSENSDAGNTEPPPPPGPAGSGAVYVESNPAGAAIIFDGRDTGLETPATLDNIAAGSYDISVALNGYDAYNANIDVFPDSTVSWLVPDLSPLPGELAISSQPEGAAIIIDGNDTGQRTPATFQRFEPGTYKIQLQLKGFKTFTGNTTLEPGGKAEVSQVLSETEDVNPPPSNAELVVTTSPSGASILLNGRATQRKTPHTFTDLTPGHHQLKLVLNGFREGIRDVDLAAGKSSQINLDLKPLPAGKIRINSFELKSGAEQLAFANVFVDGEEFGQTPREIELEGGKHTVTVKLLGYSNISREIEVKPGKTETVKFVFSR